LGELARVSLRNLISTGTALAKDLISGNGEASKNSTYQSQRLTIEGSDFFDGIWYLKHNPDVRMAGIDPLSHYINHGATEGRNPSPFFDTKYYLATNPDVAGAKQNPLAHFVRQGAKAKRSPHPLFNMDFYLQNNPDVAALGTNPLAHYIAIGASEGRLPNPTFNCPTYSVAGDIVDPGLDALAHFFDFAGRVGLRGWATEIKTHLEAKVIHAAADISCDPWLILVHKQTGWDLALQPGQYHFTFRARPPDRILGAPMLYLDMGGGFSKKSSQTFQLANHNVDTWSLNFHIDAPAVGVRLDLRKELNSRCEILDLTVTTVDGVRGCNGNSNTFCVAPFIQAEIMTTGVVKACNVFNGFIEKNGHPMSVYQDQFSEIWNSDEYRNLRRRMIEGNVSNQCINCTAREKQNIPSTRQQMNYAWGSLGWGNPHNNTSNDLVEAAVANDFRIPGGPKWIELNLGNLCNLRCRMCSGVSSSRIASDPVQARWSTYDIGAPARWIGRSMIIAPRRKLGVEYEGLSELDWNGASPLAWMNGVATIRLRNLGQDVSSIQISLTGAECPSAPVVVFFNGAQIMQCALSDGNIEMTCDLSNRQRKTEEFILRIECPKRIAIQEVKLFRAQPGSNRFEFSRFLDSKQWFQDKNFLQGELLAHAANLTKIDFKGGEPFLIEEVPGLLQYLISQGVATNLELLFVTNGTVADDAVCDLLSQFKAVSLVISLDGVGAVNDYIRDGSDWNEIHSNIDRFLKIPNATLTVNTVYQAYNMLHVADVANYANEMGMRFICNFLSNPPYLSCFAMPPDARKDAALRIRRYTENHFVNKSDAFSVIERTLVNLARALEANQAPNDPVLLEKFMRFTNDLDHSRGQEFSLVNAALFDIIRSSGVRWP
jgi:hypothetical protein